MYLCWHGAKVGVSEDKHNFFKLNHKLHILFRVQFQMFAAYDVISIQHIKFKSSRHQINIRNRESLSFSRHKHSVLLHLLRIRILQKNETLSIFSVNSVNVCEIVWLNVTFRVCWTGFLFGRTVNLRDVCVLMLCYSGDAFEGSIILPWHFAIVVTEKIDKTTPACICFWRYSEASLSL